jgi:hypothetical protein
VVSLEITGQPPVLLEVMQQTIELEMVAVQGLAGRDGIDGIGTEPPITLSATQGQTTFTLPKILTVPSAAKLVVNGIIYSYGTSWQYNSSTSTLTWINSAFSLSPTDEIQLYL